MTLQFHLHIATALGTALLAFILAGPGFAQPVPQDGDAADPALTEVSPQPPPATGVGPGAGPPAATNPATSPGTKAAPGDAALKQRVEQLEEQLVDMQVLVGTLESLARGGAPASLPARGDVSSGDAASGYGATADPRVDGLETQVRALAAQIEQLTAQVQALSAASRRSDAGAAAPSPPGTAATPGLPDPSRFGSTTVTAGRSDAIGGLIESGPSTPAAPAAPLPGTAAAPPPSGTAAPPAPSDVVATAPPAFMPPQPGAQDPSGNPKQLYETAYGYLMQRDYGAAQAAFEDFLTRYPKDSLAGNAQYWLGEAHFVRGEYKAAAGAFLKGYQNYAGNARAADSLLKLAMSLDRLGQKDAACSSYSELSSRFPDAPENVKTRAKSERQRIHCP